MTELEEQMRESARRFEFEKAVEYRDRLKLLKERMLDEQDAPNRTVGVGSDTP
jgi:excinuclease UvrABC nuclease subunit